MFDEIEQFIRKAAQAAQEAAEKARAEQEAKRRPPLQQQPQPQQRPPQRPAQPQRPSQQQRPKPGVRTPPNRISAPPPTLQPVLEAEVLQPVGRPLSRLPSEHLAHDVELSDDKLQAHVQEVFDHKVGRLKQSADESAPSGPPVNVKAVALHDLLTLPGNLRNAVILAEILKRPDFF